jgi:hypothetical protein
MSPDNKDFKGFTNDQIRVFLSASDLAQAEFKPTKVEKKQMKQHERFIEKGVEALKKSGRFNDETENTLYEKADELFPEAVKAIKRFEELEDRFVRSARGSIKGEGI